jgi:hypothetical protein
MRVLLTRLTERTHRFEAIRADGSRESAELETRSVLLHDLVHYAVEAEAGISDGFFGRLAAGTTLAQLKQAPYSGDEADAGLGRAESLVGPMQSLHQGRGTREQVLERGRARHPEVVTAEFVDGVLERLRRLVGHWRATPFGASMELRWPPVDTRAGDTRAGGAR